MTTSKTSDLIAFQRVIETEAKAHGMLTLEALLKAISVTFARYKTQKAISKNITRLAKLGLLSVQSALEATSLELSNESAKMTYGATKKIQKKSLFSEVGVTGTIPDSTGENHRRIILSLRNEVNRLIPTGVDLSDVERSLRATAKAAEASATTTARTAYKLAEQVGEEKARQEDPDVIGYEWVSVLDGVTSSTCLDLNGKKFYYNRSGAKPKPPAHHNCRSSTIPLYKDTSKNIKVESVKEWAEKNPKEARSSMGETRYKLYKDGDLKVERFTDVNGRPFTLEQLQKRNQKAFEKAKIE